MEKIKKTIALIVIIAVTADVTAAVMKKLQEGA